MQSYTGKTGIDIQQHADAYRDLQRLTEADREAHAAAKRCIDSLAGRDRERYIQR